MYVDAHSHLDRYDSVSEWALDSALVEINENQILTLSTSMDLPSYHRNLEISRRCSLVIPACGVHPWNAAKYADRLDDLAEAVEGCSMIGEIGLDQHFVKDASAYSAQRQVFEFFLDAASAHDKIINLHTKGAEKESLELLDRYQVPRVIVHWYSGSLDVFKEMVARGFYFTLGVEVLYSEHIQTIARELPSSQLLTETDNPGAPRGFIGRPGTPALIKEVVQGVAQARGAAPEAIIQAVQANLLALIGHDPRLSPTRLLLEGWQTDA